jgi:hypothetical protein
VRAWPRGGPGVGAPVEFWVGAVWGGQGRVGKRTREDPPATDGSRARRADWTQLGPRYSANPQKLTTPSTPVSTPVDTLYAAGVTPVTPGH